jgi:DsbC/DsbD-like thiol-disulfide interchange protein
MIGRDKSVFSALAACGFVITLAAPARANDASAWSDDSRSAVRLIAGANKSGATPLRAGIEIKLQPGWHTYWRYPGDSGVPPRFDFSGSENLKSATVLYPAPQIHSDETGETLVYDDDVIFPVQVTPQESSKPVKLHLKMDYAVCEKMCIPAEGSADIPLGAGGGGHDAALKSAEARVPKPVSATEAGLSARRVNDGSKPAVIVDVAVPEGKDVQVLAEGPTPDWALPIPKPQQGAPAGHRQFGFALEGLPPGGNPKAPVDLIFTVVEGDRALEVKTHLD